MLGTNPVAEDERKGTGHILSIVKGSPFLTIQGEGPFVGELAVFLRLHGCNLRCTFCDTSFSDPDDPISDAVTIDKMVWEASEGRTGLVVITGGEPMRQNLLPLIHLLKAKRGAVVQIETAGTYWQRDIDLLAQIVCSPKTAAIDHDIYRHAHYFKYVIDARMEFEDWIPITATQPGARAKRLASPRPGAPVFLSPMYTGDGDQDADNVRKVGELAKRYSGLGNPIRAGIQLHRLLDLP